MIPGLGRSAGEGIDYPLQYSWPPLWLAGKESARNAGDLGSIPGLGRFPWRRETLPTSIFWLGEFHGLYSPWGRKSQTRLNDLHFTSLTFTPPLIYCFSCPCQKTTNLRLIQLSTFPTPGLLNDYRENHSSSR